VSETITGSSEGGGRDLNLLSLSLLCIPLGLLSGLGALAFRWLLALVHNLFFFGRFSWSYDPAAHPPPSPCGPFIIFAPVAGAMIVVFLVRNFAPEAKGSGVPEVMDSIYYGEGRMRAVVALVKPVASAFSVGSGGSIGKEGPSLQMGAALGSTLGRITSVSARQKKTLVCAGAGAAMAATFNAPIGSMLFLAEVVLHEFSVRTLTPLATATIAASAASRILSLDNPLEALPHAGLDFTGMSMVFLLLSCAIMGVLMGGASTVFIRAVYSTEDFLKRFLKGGAYMRHAGSMLLVGVLMYLLMVTSGHYYVDGLGYPTMNEILFGELTSGRLLLVLFAAKMLSTSLTLGSGAAGGIFSPALYLGATLGGAYAALVNGFFPIPAAAAPVFALAGMSAMVGGSTGAVLAATVMLFEMTRDHNAVLPMILAASVSSSVRKFLLRDTIYTMKLSRAGHQVPGLLKRMTRG
jgi:CIC family chloride channel protein